jgi:hypothetical protein
MAWLLIVTIALILSAGVWTSVGEATSTARLKTGAESPNRFNNVLGAPSFSPYQS